MSLRTKLVSGLLSLTIVAGAMAGTVEPSAAQKLTTGEIAAIAGIGGFVIGLGIASSAAVRITTATMQLLGTPRRPLLRPLPDL